MTAFGRRRLFTRRASPAAVLFTWLVAMATALSLGWLAAYGG